jgi:hypothetical protein
MAHHVKTFKFYKNNLKCLHLSNRLKISYPLYLTNNEQLRKNKHTTSIRTLENGVAHHLKTFKFYKNNFNRLHLSDPLKISYPLYLTNNEQLKKKHTKRFKTLKNEEYITSKPQKKKKT